LDIRSPRRRKKAEFLKAKAEIWKTESRKQQREIGNKAVGFEPRISRTAGMEQEKSQVPVIRVLSARTGADAKPPPICSPTDAGDEGTEEDRRAVLRRRGRRFPDPPSAK
jgi:hypothetical protein